MLPPREWMENSSARSKWICTPGQHIVRIVGYKQDSKKSGKPVIFELQDDHGRKQTIRFLQSTTALKAGQLLRFVVAANNWLEQEHQGCEFSVANARTFKSLMGRSIAIFVQKTPDGYYSVVDFIAVAVPSASQPAAVTPAKG